jgi:hypothetical protein
MCYENEGKSAEYCTQFTIQARYDIVTTGCFTCIVPSTVPPHSYVRSMPSLYYHFFALSAGSQHEHVLTICVRSGASTLEIVEQGCANDNWIAGRETTVGPPTNEPDGCLLGSSRECQRRFISATTRGSFLTRGSVLHEAGRRDMRGKNLAEYSTLWLSAQNFRSIIEPIYQLPHYASNLSKDGQLNLLRSGIIHLSVLSSELQMKRKKHMPSEMIEFS